MFREVPLRMMVALGVRRPRGSATEVVEVAENGEVVNREMGSDTSTSVCQSF